MTSTVNRSGIWAGRHSTVELAGHEVDEPALGLDAVGLAHELDRDLDPDGLVHGDLDQVGVQELVGRSGRSGRP